ncbi:NDR1/HIN1-like protein 13 [Vicia villosa]|uniref:NDR1/HIN1-like protein 13 n=1 Tax=Vicia villosa TaxID=3911 RepID=UPI00273B9E01|nr:NDR1/HIN1-like protein 13 [Vicia villosa]
MPESQNTSSSERPALASNTAPPPVYGYPSPANGFPYANINHRKNSWCGCCCCLWWFIGIILTLAVLLVIAVVSFCLITRPELPYFALDSIAVNGMDLTSTSVISPAADVFIRADNGNNKIGIYYEKDSIVEIFYRDVRLCNGVLQAFYQPTNNVTVLQTVLKGKGIKLAETDRKALVKAVGKWSVPLTLKMRVPVKIKVGLVKTWKIGDFVFDCDVTVDQLTAEAKIVDNDCSYGLHH